MAHPKSVVARVKGALLAGLGPKFVAHKTGIPLGTVKRIAAGVDHAKVEPDRGIMQALEDLLTGRADRGSVSQG